MTYSVIVNYIDIIEKSDGSYDDVNNSDIIHVFNDIENAEKLIDNIKNHVKKFEPYPFGNYPEHYKTRLKFYDDNGNIVFHKTDWVSNMFCKFKDTKIIEYK